MKTRVGIKFSIVATVILLLFATFKLAEGRGLSIPDKSFADLAAEPLTVTGVEPDTVVNDTSHLLMVSGTGFTDTFTITIGTMPLLEAAYVNTTTLTATLPTGVPVGVYAATVTLTSGQSASLANALTVQNPPPSISSVTPDQGLYGQETILTITGTDFIDPPGVFLGITPCTTVGFVNANTITATVPLDLLPDVYDLVVRNPGPGLPQVFLEDAFTLYSPEPTITTIQPIEGANDLDLQVAITGTDFVPTLDVALGNIGLQDITWQDSNQLTAVVPWGMDDAIYDLSVTNPGPGAPADTRLQAYTVTQGIGVLNAGAIYGGAIAELVVDPNSPETVYAVIENLGMFRSDDGGANWDFKYSHIQVKNLVVDPLAPNRLYIYGHWGLNRSDDYGETWISLDTPFPNSDSPLNSCWERARIFVHPTQAGKLYATSCGEEQGLIMSTDYGENWTPKMAGLTDPFVSALAFRPGDPETIFAGTTAGNIFMSTNGGDAWNYLAQPLGYIHDLVFNPFNSNDLWAVSGLFDTDTSYPPARNTNASFTTWETVDIASGELGHVVAFSPVLPGTLYVVSNYQVYISNNGGLNWTTFGGGDGWGDIAPHPTDINTVYRGGLEHGVQKTVDGGVTWFETNQGLTGMMPQNLEPIPGQPGDFYTHFHGGEVGIWLATRGGASWQLIPNDEFGAVWGIAVDPITTTRIYAGAFSKVAVSEDSGQTWDYSQLPLPPQYIDCEAVHPHALKIHPTQMNRLLAGGRIACGENRTDPGVVYLSTDYGQSWSHGIIHDVSEILQVWDIVFDPVDPEIAYFSTASTGLFRTSDGGENWYPIGSAYSGLADVGSLAVEQYPPYRLYAAGRGGSPNLYYSEDQGLSWYGFPWNPDLGINIEKIVITPEAAPLLYAATPEGLRRSMDGGQTWSRAAGALGYVNIGSLAVVRTMDRTILYVGTTGGFITPEAAQTAGLSASDTLVRPGVYRYTTTDPDHWVYLPLIMR